MAAGEALFVLLLALFGLGAPLMLYVRVRGEHDEREAMSRGEAERTARRDRRD